MKISDTAKTKILGVCTIILGLLLLSLVIIEIYLGKINISCKVGCGEITFNRDPFSFLLKILIELFGSLAATIGGVLILLNKLPKK